MPILSGDVKLVASAVMDDVPEGGGAPTATVIVDGTSNAIFPDVSELDRAGGRVNLRKLHVSVQTLDTDTYLGSNIIVAEPPADPNISVTIFSTNDVFDRREEARGRIESYLTQGPEWSGFLFENHIIGQRAIQICQRVATEPPSIGRTLVLIGNEGLGSQYQQYIRITKITTETRTFYDGASYFPAQLITAEISDALRYDFFGSSANRGFSRTGTSAHLRDTLVADAGTYAGVVPLTSPVALGALTCTAAGVYTQLVPSAQTEIPLVDYNAAGTSDTITETGTSTVSYTTAQVLNSTTALALGVSVTPGSLTIAAGGVTLTESGGQIFEGAAPVGLIDYALGTVTFATLASTYGGTKTITFKPAVAPQRLANSLSRKVTQETRAYNYTAIVLPTPAAGSVQVSYRANNRWYTLRDNGSGSLKGLDSSFGAGTVNYATGSVLITTGALPDVGSHVIFQWSSPVNYTQRSNFLVPSPGVSIQLTDFPVNPGSVVITWNNGTAQTATDNAKGLITGSATGTVDYATGRIQLTPPQLSLGGQEFSVGYSKVNPALQTVQVAPLLVRQPNTTVAVTLGSGNITPKTVAFDITLQLSTGIRWEAFADSPTNGSAFILPPTVALSDDGNGVIRDYIGNARGTINYLTGVMNFQPDGEVPATEHQYLYVTHEFGSYMYVNKILFNPAVPSAMAINSGTTFRFSSAGAGIPKTPEVTTTTALRIDITPGYGETIVPGSVIFTLGGRTYFDRAGSLYNQQNVNTGVATLAGSINYLNGVCTISNWLAGGTTTVELKALLTSSGTQEATQAVFRIPVAPIRVGSLQILATKLTGGLINVTADNQGVISAAGVRGTVDYSTGVVTLEFGTLVTAAGNEAASWYRVEEIVGGQIWKPQFVFTETIKYNAVAFTYLPLDANLLGLDPVRLPQDGRVPIFRTGGFAVIGNTQRVTATVANAQVINAGRVRLSRVRVIGNNGVVINTGYTADLEAGTVTFTNVSGYSQPVTVENRIEDMMQISDVQINGQLGFTRQITHDYPVLGSYVSSALISADLKARVSHLFDQQTFNGAWVNAAVGSPSTATFNDVLAPLVVTNRGAVTERWALLFTSSTNFNIIGEHVGVIGTGSINTVTEPQNPATGVPYFSIPTAGWGSGWSVGNVVRLNTVGAMFPIWVVRTVQQGPNTGTEHSFTLLSRGDVDRT